MNVTETQVGKLAVRGLAWSIVQNWGGRIITFVLFVILARLLTPEQFGLASAAMIVLLLIAQLAEFGFGDAIVQRRDYQPADANLPFFVAVASATLLAALCAFRADWIEAVLEVQGIQPIVVALALLAPLQTISTFQEAIYKRNFVFRKLAFRVLIANLIAGLIATVCALAGAGVWSLVAQTYIATLIGLVWLWSRPLWTPSLTLHWDAFREMARFGLPVVSVRLLDFGASRLFEVLIIARYGVAVYGLYAAASRLYITLSQLLQTALNTVSLSILSRISHDRERMSQIYLQTITIASLVFAPIFVASSALMPEISNILFGARWQGLAEIASPLLLVGAVQSVQFLNGPYLSSRGRTGIVLFVNLIKNASIVLGVILIDTDNIVRFVQYFCILQLASSPFSFAITARELHVSFVKLVLCVVPSFIGCMIAYFVVEAARPYTVSLFPGFIQGSFIEALTLGAVFGIVFLASYALVGFRQLVMVRTFVVRRLRER